MKNEKRFTADGTFYYCNDFLHREDGPACELTDGTKIWMINGERHRLDGPALIYPNGDKYWYQRGKYHRINGPAIEYATGNKAWYQDGELHRLDGPAIENITNGYSAWYLYGKKLEATSMNIQEEGKQIPLLPPARKMISIEDLQERYYLGSVAVSEKDKSKNITSVAFSGVNRGPIHKSSVPYWRRYAVLLSKNNKKVVAKVICQTDIEEWAKNTGNKIISAFRMLGEINPEKEKTEFSDES